MSSAICFNLDQSKILLSGNGLSHGKTVRKDEWFYEGFPDGNEPLLQAFNFITDIDLGNYLE